MTTGKNQSRTSLSNPMALKPGAMLNNRYLINRMIGQGGIGIVYDGTDIELDRHVAIKEYFPENSAFRNVQNSYAVTAYGNIPSYDKGLEDFCKQSANLAKFSEDPNIVHAYHTFRENNTAYLVMEFIEGQTLDAYIRAKKRLSWKDTFRIAEPLMNALEHVHAAGLLHRDVTPSNIMIGNDGIVRLLDFGAAGQSDPDERSISVIYKYDYYPPEQLDRYGVQGTYSDVYSLCAVIYQMLTGKAPVRGQDDMIKAPSQVGANLPRAANNAIMSGLASDYTKRIQTVKELRDAILTRQQSGAGNKKLAGKSGAARQASAGYKNYARKADAVQEGQRITWYAGAVVIIASIVIFIVGLNMHPDLIQIDRTGSESNEQAETPYNTVFVNECEIREYTFTSRDYSTDYDLFETKFAAVIKNNSFIAQEIDMHVTAYDKDGKEIEARDGYVEALAPGEETVEYVWFAGEVDHFKAKYTCSKTEKLSIISDLEVKVTENAKHTILEVTNKSNRACNAKAIALYKTSDGKVVFIDDITVDLGDYMKPGETQYVEFFRESLCDTEYYFQGIALSEGNTSYFTRKELDAKDFEVREYATLSAHYTPDYLLAVKNNSKEEASIGAKVIAFDANGAPIEVDTEYLMAIGPGEESAMNFFFFEEGEYDRFVYQLVYKKKEDPLVLSAISNISLQAIVDGENIVLQVVNNGDRVLNTAVVHAVLLDAEDYPVKQESFYFFDLEPGKVYEETMRNHPGRDHEKFYIEADEDVR